MREIIDHDFVARGELFRDGISTPITIRGTYSEFEHKPVKCVVIPNKVDHNFQSILGVNDLWQLKGVAQDGEDIWISTLDFIYSHGYKDSFYWEGIADNFIKGNLEEFDATNGKIYCSLFVPPTPLAQTHGYICSHDGTIRFENPTTKKKGVTWTTKYGNAELIDGYSYAKHQVGINSAVIQIQRCQISFEIRQKGFTSLADVLRECADTFDNTLWLISLLSRKRLAWYAGEALYLPDEGSKTPFQKAIIHRNLHLGYESTMGYGEHESDLLISPDKLKTELFQDLLTNYASSKYRESIQRASMYVLMSYERAYFEAYIGIVYLALETLVAGLYPNRTKENSSLLETKAFKRLSKEIEKVVRQEAKEEETALALIENLIKINSSKPPSLANKLLSLLKQYKVPINRLWPSGVNVEKKLREIITRRDLYIHKGEIEDLDEYLYDFARVRTLVELWLLKLLACPDEVINSHYLTSLAPIDRVESPKKTKGS